MILLLKLGMSLKLICMSMKLRGLKMLKFNRDRISTQLYVLQRPVTQKISLV